MDGRQEPKQDYLAKAEQAEAMAAQTSDIVTRNALLKTARNYRHLAAFILSRVSSAASADKDRL